MNEREKFIELFNKVKILFAFEHNDKRFLKEIKKYLQEMLEIVDKLGNLREDIAKSIRDEKKKILGVK